MWEEVSCHVQWAGLTLGHRFVHSSASYNWQSPMTQVVLETLLHKTYVLQ